MKQAYVTADGSYGGEDILLFDPDTLNDNQWEMLTDMADGDRIVYVHAIRNKDDVAVRAIEMDNFGEEFGLDG
tara:strand:+ start:69 stop:287 length:219 start_codon:yes stop_codon:yes gene_type:complete